MTEHSKQRLNELLELKESRLHELEKQQALQGISTPPHVNIEVEDIKRDIAVMRDALYTGIPSPKSNNLNLFSKSKLPNSGRYRPYLAIFILVLFFTGGIASYIANIFGQTTEKAQLQPTIEALQSRPIPIDATKEWQKTGVFVSDGDVITIRVIGGKWSGFILTIVASG